MSFQFWSEILPITVEGLEEFFILYIEDLEHASLVSVEPVTPKELQTAPCNW